MAKKYYVESDFNTGLVNHFGEPVSRFGSAEPCRGGLGRAIKDIFIAAYTKPAKSEIHLHQHNEIHYHVTNTKKIGEGE